MTANLPVLGADRMKWNYTQLFMLTLIWNVALAAMSVFSIWVILLIIKLKFGKIRKYDEIPETLEYVNSENKQVHVNQQSQADVQRALIAPPAGVPKWKLILSGMVSIFFYFVLLSSALMYLAAFMFGKFGIGTGMDILNMFAIFCIVAIPTIFWKHFTRTKPPSQMRKEWKITAILLFMFAGLTVMAVLMSRRACLCVFNDRYGITINKDFRLSTQFTRNSKGKICKEDQICHLYATLPQDTDTSVFFNIQTGTDVKNIELALLEKSKFDVDPTFQKIKEAQSIEVGKTLEFNGQRNLFTVLFNDLTPDTSYVVRIQGGNKINLQTLYRTLPSFQSNTTLNVAFGGDVGMTNLGADMTMLLKTYDPHVIIVGGDVAYDDAMPDCYYSWDNFYEIFQNLNSNLGRIIPLILSVGNHDVGFDALANVSIKPTKEGPFFFAFNPQHYANASTKSGIPAIQNRATVHYHRLGKILMMNLDSGYLINFQNQTKFIEQVSQSHGQYQKIANYHNPLYPTCGDVNNIYERNPVNEGRKWWVPLFQKYKFLASMQHHTHHMKYTYPLKDGQKNEEDGVVYVGDGCWGVANDPCSINKRIKDDIFDSRDDDNSEHIWVMTVSEGRANFRALDTDGTTKFQNSRKFRV